MIGQTIEQLKILEGKGYSKENSLMIILIEELKNLREVLNEFSNKK